MGEPVVSSLVGKVVDLLFGVAIKEISYMWNCQENVEKLKNEVEKLKDMKGRIQQQIDLAKDKGDNLIRRVEEWLNKADDEIAKADDFLKQEASSKKTCFKIGMCGNWGTLYHYGKMATKMTLSLLQLLDGGKTYERGVSVYTPAPGPLDVYENKNLDDIVTHNSALGDIIKSLDDENIQIIGIYGLGGVGKTTLAMEVAARVKNDLFVAVAFTTVSQNVDANKIQKDTEDARKRIVKGEKVLIILDDVWEKLNLEQLCIPIKHKNCKILITSRSQDVCEKMNAQSKTCVNSLPTKEAWIIFKRVVGERLETEADLQPVAKEVVEECGGLPLLIQAVGSALKSKSIHSWNVALSRLKKHAPSEIDPDIRKAFTHLKLSYDYLESEEAKWCFLLCSMFPEDNDIKLEDLVRYGVGLGKFDDLDSIQEARDRVQNAVDILKSSSLLLNVRADIWWYKPCTKMHDVVRDVALLIVSQGENKYLVEAGKGLREWQPRNKSLESYTGISLMGNMISELPGYEVDLSSLDIFLVNKNYLSMISDEFIKGMKEVKVLDMGLCSISSLPQSLKLLTKLRMLNLEGNRSFHEISILGELIDLEILILNGTGIKGIPQEIGQLVNLRWLEVTECEYMTRVTPGVISKLQRLEELCIEFSEVSEGVYECLVEVMKLWKLTYLDLTVKSFKVVPQGFISQKMKVISIQIGGDYRYPSEVRTSSKSAYYLYRIENLKNIMPDVYHRGANKVEDIYLRECPNVSCLVDDDDDSTRCSDWDDQGKIEKKYFMEVKSLYIEQLDKLEVLWKCPDEYISLTNLVTLFIYECHKLERVFTLSVAQGLVNLKDLSIRFCDGLEEVIWGEGGGGGEEIAVEQQQHSSSSSAANNINIVFPSLAIISLSNSKSLKRFFNYSAAAGGGNGNGNCSSIIIIKYPSLLAVYINDCIKVKKWGPGIHETPNLHTMVVHGNNPFFLCGRLPINVAVEKSWRKLKADERWMNRITTEDKDA